MNGTKNTQRRPKLSPGPLAMLFRLHSWIFTARRYASAVLAMALCLSVCLSVGLSVTSRCSTKMAKRRITQTTPHDSPRTLVFWRQRSPMIRPGSRTYGAPNAGGVGQSRRLSTNNCLYPENGTWFLLKSNRKEVVCALSNGDIADDLESPLTTLNHPIFCILHRHS